MVANKTINKQKITILLVVCIYFRYRTRLVAMTSVTGPVMFYGIIS